MAFSKYLAQFTRDTSASQTHLSFNKGKYNVPDKKYDEFYKKYYQAYKAGEPLYLIEKVHASIFAFFLDLEAPRDTAPLESTAVKSILHTTIQLIHANTSRDTVDTFETAVFVTAVDTADNVDTVDTVDTADNVDTVDTVDNVDTADNVDTVANANVECVVSRRMNKYHINFPNVIVNNDTAMALAREIKAKLPQLGVYIDSSVYRTGLRMFGSQKVYKGTEPESELVYRLYDLDTLEYVDDISYEIFLKTVVRRPAETPVTMTVLTPSTSTSVSMSPRSPTSTGSIGGVPQIKAITNAKILREISDLLGAIRAENDYFTNYDLTVQSVTASKNKFGVFCYYVVIPDRVCPFVQREHKRESNPVYVELSSRGVCIKCYDEDCLRQRYPPQGVPFGDSFYARYPNLAATLDNYISGPVNVTDTIRGYLEESLSGSHYKVAKAAFEVYKSRFRVDDVKNTEFFEFDGTRWKRSYRINLLLSDDLPKYYNAIKTATDSDKLEEGTSNVKNAVIDNLINKLENVNFKSNVTGQLVYLLKCHDTDFYKLLDQTPGLLGFKNGVYDFSTGTFRQGRQGDYITFSTGYEYTDYDQTSPEINEIYMFLSQIIPNKRVLEYTLKVLGKALVGVPDEKFYLWTGLSGANGKSTLINLLENTLGDYISSVDVSLLTNKRTGSSNATPDIVRLRGRRIFTFQEPEHNDRLRTGILKQFTGGDTIVARELFKAPVSFKLQGTMVMCCNDLPAVSSIDGGTWRRIRVIEFTSRFCENPTKPNEFKIDPKMKQKISQWRPYFMSILLHYYQKYKNMTLTEPEEVTIATAKYKVENDKFNEFFDNCIEPDSAAFESNKSIYNYFTGWWSSNYPMSKIPDIRELRRAMKIKFGNEVELKVNGIKEYGFGVCFHNIAGLCESGGSNSALSVDTDL